MERFKVGIICSLALFSFVSIAVGNIFLAMATLMFLYVVYTERKQNKFALPVDGLMYFKVYGFFLVTMLLSALASGDIGKGLKTFVDLWVWRFMPFAIIVLSIKEYCQAKKILASSLLGISIGILCLLFQGFTGASRAAGFFGHPMTFAGYLCVFLPIFLVCACEKEIFGRHRWISAVFFILGFVAIIFNATRGAWVALAPVLTCIIFYYMFKSKKACVIGLVCIAVLGGGLSQYKPFMKRVNTISNVQANRERFLIWNSAYNMFKDHPVLGVGLGQYKDNYQKKYISKRAREPKLTHAHSNFMQMLGENGTVGFVGFVTLISFIILNNIRNFYKTRSPYALMMAASTIALVIQGLTEYNFGNSAVMKVFWLVMGCLLVMDIARKEWINSDSKEKCVNND